MGRDNSLPFHLWRNINTIKCPLRTNNKKTWRYIKMDKLPLKGYRTYIVSLLMAVFGVLALADWNSFLDNPTAGMVALISAIIMAVLRSITTTPPGVNVADLNKPSDK